MLFDIVIPRGKRGRESSFVFCSARGSARANFTASNVGLFAVRDAKTFSPLFPAYARRMRNVGRRRRASDDGSVRRAPRHRRDRTRRDAKV